MLKTVTLFDNPWLSLMEVRDPEAGVNGYVYSHETRCQGRIVAVLPFRKTDSGEIEYGVRREVTPCWGMASELSALTGGLENGSLLGTAVAEIKEEAGFDVSTTDLVPLGLSFGTKSTDTEYWMYAVDVTDLVEGEVAEGDGTRLDAEGTMEWHGEPLSNDPLVAQMISRFRRQVEFSGG